MVKCLPRSWLPSVNSKNVIITITIDTNPPIAPTRNPPMESLKWQQNVFNKTILIEVFRWINRHLLVPSDLHEENMIITVEIFFLLCTIWANCLILVSAKMFMFKNLIKNWLKYAKESLNSKLNNYYKQAMQNCRQVSSIFSFMYLLSLFTTELQYISVNKKRLFSSKTSVCVFQLFIWYF